MANVENEKEFVFTWRIENFSSSDKKNGEFLLSPKFTTERLDGSRWYLKLYPRGDKKSEGYYLSCYLVNEVLHSENVNLEFRIEISGKDKEILASQRSENKVFEKGFGWGWANFMKLEEYDNRMNTWSDDIFIVRCHMISKERNNKLADGCEARTKLGVDRCSFQWSVQNPDSDWSESKTLSFPKISQLEVKLTAPEDDILIEIHKIKETPLSQFVKCKMTLLDVEGNELNSKSGKYLFDSTDTIWKFPSFISKSLLKDKQDTLVKNGMFRLICELSASSDIVSERIENYLYDTPSADSAVKVDTHSYLLHDLCKMFASKKYPDVHLRSGTATLPAHKSVLSARSNVFSAIFDVDTVESQTIEVDIPEVDSGILNSFLEFLYTGNVENMDYEDALKLLFAADIYQVQSLKEKCSAFLMSIFSDGNIREVLALADKIGYEDLKSLAMDYIKSHSDRILLSPEWHQWIEKNYKLGLEVLSNLSADIGARKKSNA